MSQFTLDMSAVSEERPLCLNFANTAEWHASEHPIESLTSYSELVAWSQRAGILTSPQARGLLRLAGERPAEASAALERAIALREAIYAVFSAAARGRAPEASDLDTLNEALAAAMARSRITFEAGDYAWNWDGYATMLDAMLWPVARSAADLLTSGSLARVGQCADDRGCGWLFLDTSRNHTRRWCDMKDCGNRAKARRHYTRKKSPTAHSTAVHD